MSKWNETKSAALKSTMVLGATCLLVIGGTVPLVAQSQAAGQPGEVRFRLTGGTVPLAAQSQAEQAATAEVDATIRAASSQNNFEILDQAAAEFENLRQFNAALKLRQAALAIRGQISGTQSANYVVGLVKLGDLARRRGTAEEATGYYEQAVALGDRPETAEALLYLGMRAYRPTDGTKAMAYFQRVRNLATDVTVQAHALTWMAVVQQDAGQFAEAESLFQTAGSMEDPASVDAAYTKELYGRFLRQQNRVNEAEPVEARAKEIRKEHIAQLMTRRPAAERQAFAGSVYRVGGGVTAPSLLQKLEPSYSEEARATKLSGTVLVRVVIGTDGKASDIELLQGLGLGLDEQAVFAISQWQFKPGTKDGVPVPVQAQIEVNFRLL